MSREWNAVEVTGGYLRVALTPAMAHDTAPAGDAATGIRQSAQNHGANYWLLDPFCRHVLTTNASSIIVESIHDIDVLSPPDGGWESTGCLVNGTMQGDGAHLALGGPQQFTYSGLPAGTNTIELIHGPGTHLTAGAQLRGMPIVAVRIPLGSTYAITMPTAPVKRVLVRVPSIGDGAKVTVGSPNASATYQGSWMLARAHMKASVSGAWAGAQVTVSGGSQERWFDWADASVRAATITRMATQLNGTGSNLLVLDGEETNDYGAATQSLAAFGTMVGDFLDAFHVALPSVTVKIITAAYYNPGESTNNAQGWTLVQARAAIVAAAASRSSYCSTLAGVGLVTYPGNYAPDGVHPNTAGQAEKEAGFRTFIDY